MNKEQKEAVAALVKLSYKELQEVLRHHEDITDGFYHFCGDCGMPCKPVRVDQGCLPGVHDYTVGSKCCGATVFDDYELESPSEIRLKDITPPTREDLE